MIRHLVFYSFTFAVAANALPAFAQNGGCNVPTARAGLYLNESNASSIELPRQAKISVGAFPRDLYLNYKMPGSVSPAHAGVVAVKISQSPNPSDAQATVRVKRDGYPYVCGTRDVIDAVNFYNFLGRVYPAVDEEVPVDQYIFYHKTTSDFRQLALYNFHVHYRDRNGSCVRTDDKGNGNRVQFLYGERTQENRLIARQLYESGQAAAADYAASMAKNTPAGEYARAQAEEFKKRIKNNAEISVLSERYRRLGKLETQIHHYSDNQACIPIQISEARVGQAVTITINDLEQRNSRGRRVEETWSLEDSVTRWIGHLHDTERACDLSSDSSDISRAITRISERQRHSLQRSSCFWLWRYFLGPGLHCNKAGQVAGVNESLSAQWTPYLLFGWIISLIIVILDNLSNTIVYTKTFAQFFMGSVNAAIAYSVLAVIVTFVKTYKFDYKAINLPAAYAIGATLLNSVMLWLFVFA